MEKNTLINSIFNAYVLSKSKDADNILSAIYADSDIKLTASQVSNMKLQDFIVTKANESMSTDQATFGGNFVNGEVLINTILDRVRDRETLLTYIPNQMNMANPIVGVPVEWDDPVMSAFAENADVPGTPASTSKAGTRKLTLTAKHLALTVYYSRDLLEDSVINIANYVDRKLEQAFVNAVHTSILNGDTTNTTGINGAVTAGDPRLSFNGLRKLAIDGSNVVSWAMTLSLLRQARAKLDEKGVYPEDLVLVVDYQTYNRLLWLSQVETLEKFGNAATVINGVLSRLDGVRVVPRKELWLAQATGIIDTTTTANNVFGQAVLFHAPSMQLGWRRMLDVEGDYDTTTQQFFTTGSTRFDFQFNEFDAPAAALITTDLS